MQALILGPYALILLAEAAERRAREREACDESQCGFIHWIYALETEQVVSK
jgi:hypothetical protein